MLGMKDLQERLPRRIVESVLQLQFHFLQESAKSQDETVSLFNLSSLTCAVQYLLPNLLSCVDSGPL